jgi:hypothetical protein
MRSLLIQRKLTSCWKHVAVHIKKNTLAAKREPTRLDDSWTPPRTLDLPKCGFRAASAWWLCEATIRVRRSCVLGCLQMARSFRSGGCPGASSLIRPSGPDALNDTTQSRTVWSPTPPISAAFICDHLRRSPTGKAGVISETNHVTLWQGREALRRKFRTKKEGCCHASLRNPSGHRGNHAS